ncbi:D-lyxose/D-mannose family sugar isomerase [Botrimarina sp.]|uniref:D-lyxose/D-mannose family sugar isomerase n=1 Tax=Botrimarina sp. TaxID=2795802 RepID=UPI0032ED7BCE
MKRSEVNQAVRDAIACFARCGWALPPRPRWDVTDFGRGDFRRWGLVLVNLAEEPEYCEKLMYAYRDQVTPAHTHRRKKEDIICRHGRLSLRLWADADRSTRPVAVPIDGRPITVPGGGAIDLPAGSRVTLTPGVYHEFWPSADDTVIGEVSTANDDAADNVFAEPVDRFCEIQEDEPPEVRLVGDSY